MRATRHYTSKSGILIMNTRLLLALEKPSMMNRQRVKDGRGTYTGGDLERVGIGSTTTKRRIGCAQSSPGKSERSQRRRKSERNQKRSRGEWKRKNQGNET
jgi:hypothetical protein